MGQRSDEIKKHIDTQRSELSENLEQLEQRVKSTTDWRAQFDKRPMVMLGVAFGAGLLASTLIPMGGRSRKSRSSSYGTYGATSSTGAYTGSSSLSQGHTGSQGYSGSSEGGTWTGSTRQPSATRKEMRKTWGMLDDIRASLIALGSSRLREYLGNAIPGFHEHYKQTAESRRNVYGESGSTPSYSEPSQGERTQPGYGGTYSGEGYSQGSSAQAGEPVQEAFSTGSRTSRGTERTESTTEPKSPQQPSKPRQSRP